MWAHRAAATARTAGPARRARHRKATPRRPRPPTSRTRLRRIDQGPYAHRLSGKIGPALDLAGGTGNDAATAGPVAAHRPAAATAGAAAAAPPGAPPDGALPRATARPARAAAAVRPAAVRAAALRAAGRSTPARTPAIRPATRLPARPDRAAVGAGLSRPPGHAASAAEVQHRPAGRDDRRGGPRGERRDDRLRHAEEPLRPRGGHRLRRP